MTSASIKDLGMMPGLAGVGVTGNSKSGKDGVDFGAILDLQVSADNSGQVEQNQPRVAEKTEHKTDDRVEAETDDTWIGTEETKKKEPDSEKETTDDSDNVEEVMEVLATAVMEVVNSIADVLEVEPQEVLDTIEELDMTPEAVLDLSKAGEVFVKLSGEEDISSILTDEVMYGEYQELRAEVEKVLQDVSEQLNVEPEKMESLIEQAVRVVNSTLSDETEIPDTAYVADTDPVENPESDFDPESIPLVNEKDTGVNREDGEFNASEEFEQASDNAKTAKTEGDGVGREAGHSVVSNNAEGRFEIASEGRVDAPTGFSADTQDIMNQIMDYMRIQVKADMTSFEMQLHPASLGTIHVQVASKNGTLTAQFTTQNEAVKAALESQMIELKQTFAEQGMKVEAIEVTVQTHEFEQNLEQGRERQKEEPDRKVKSRRIRLDGALSLEEIESMDEEERLAVEMMEANGTTVDYMA